MILVGAGSYIIFKPGSKDTPTGITEARPPADEAGESIIPPPTATDIEEDLAREEAAELAAKKAASEELAAREAAEKEAAEKEEAMRLAREKAVEQEKAREAALVSKNERIMEDPQAPTGEKEQAFSELLPLAREGNIKAIELCGASYWQGNGVERDRETARVWFEKGASLGNARSMLGLGYCYDLAIGGPRDSTKAVEWWTKAANLGYEVAMSRLGDYYYLNPEEKDVEKAIEWWQTAANADSPSADAMTNLGIIYSRGIETGKDLQKAIGWWKRAAELGAPEAMTELAIVHINGETAGDEADAFPLFLKAAEAGSIRAMYGLEACYRKGIGTEEDPKEADRWARIAAEKEKEAAR